MVYNSVKYVQIFTYHYGEIHNNMFFYGTAGDSPDVIRVKGICWD